MTTKTFQAKLDEILVRVEICAIHGNDPQQKWIDGKCITLSGAKQAITALIDSDLIGEDLDDGNGLDWAFGKEAKCCPGDDFAYFGNHLKKQQRSILHDTGEKR